MWKIPILFSLYLFVNSQPDSSNNTEQNNSTKVPPPKPDFSVSIEEMDKLLACSYILTKEDDRQQMNETALRLNISFETVSTKLSYEKLLKCFKEIDNHTVHYFFKDLVFMGGKDTKDLGHLVKTDYSKIDANYTFHLTNEESFTAYKFEKARTKFEEKRNDLYRENKNKMSYLGEGILNSYPFIKYLIFLAVIALSSFGVFHLLEKVTKKPKNKKKKKTQ